MAARNRASWFAGLRVCPPMNKSKQLPVIVGLGVSHNFENDSRFCAKVFSNLIIDLHQQRNKKWMRFDIFFHLAGAVINVELFQRLRLRVFFKKLAVSTIWMVIIFACTKFCDAKLVGLPPCPRFIFLWQYSWRRSKDQENFSTRSFRRDRHLARSAYLAQILMMRWEKWGMVFLNRFSIILILLLLLLLGFKNTKASKSRRKSTSKNKTIAHASARI